MLYVRLSMPVFKTLWANGDLNKEKLATYHIRASNQHKRDDLFVKITTSDTPPTKPEKEHLKRWFAAAPVVQNFTISDSFIDNLKEMELVDVDALKSKYKIEIKEMVPREDQSWWPFSLWYFRRAA